MKSDFSSIFSIPSWFWHYPYEEEGRSPGRDSSKDRGTESDNSPLLLSTGNLQSSSVLWMYLFVWYSLIIASVMNFPNSFSIPFHFSISFSDESHSLITYYIQKRRSVNLVCLIFAAENSMGYLSLPYWMIISNSLLHLIHTSMCLWYFLWAVPMQVCPFTFFQMEIIFDLW